MERLNAYSQLSTDGGITVDVEGMAVDLVMVMKAGGIDKATFMMLMAATFDNVTVEITIPERAKN